jgi:hypothetical protein
MAQTTLFSKLIPQGKTPVTGSAASGLDIGTLVQIRNGIWSAVLPDGRLKNALLNFNGSIWDFVGIVKDLITGRKYSYGQYGLGVALFEKIQCGGSLKNSSVPDDMVPLARLVFTMLLGVRVMEIADLQGLEQGIDQYYNNNPNRMDQPRRAVERAVMLVAMMGPGCWNIPLFDQYPLIAPVPDMTHEDDNQNRGKYYNGPGFGGQIFVNGILKSGPSTGLTENLDDEVVSPAGNGSIIDNFLSFVKTASPIVLLGIAAAGYYVYTEIDAND